MCVCVCVFASFAEIHINLEEGVKLAKDICLGMAYVHTLEALVQRFDLNPHNVVVGAATNTRTYLLTYHTHLLTYCTYLLTYCTYLLTYCTYLVEN